MSTDYPTYLAGDRIRAQRGLSALQRRAQQALWVDLMTSPAQPGFLDRARLMRAADWLVIAIAVSLPWSTSATGILVVVWLIVLIPTLDWADVRRELLTPAGGLPVLLVALGALGMLWADVALFARWRGFEAFLKLLAAAAAARAIPPFRSRVMRASAAMSASCGVLMLASFVMALMPGQDPTSVFFGVLVKNEATQSGEFVTCIFGLLYLLMDVYERRRWAWMVVVLALIAGMAADIVFIATGRTALVIAPLLLAVFAFKKLTAKGALTLLAGAIVFAGAAWYSSPYLARANDARSGRTSKIIRQPTNEIHRASVSNSRKNRLRSFATRR